MTGKMMWPVMGLLALTLGCKSDVDNKPAAEVNEPGVVKVEEIPQVPTEPAAPVVPATKELAVNPATSTIGWVGAKVTGDHTGEFKTFDGKMMVGENGGLEKVTFTIDTSSLTSDDDKLTGHLKSPDFLDVGKYPKASFESTEIKEGSAEKMEDGTAYTHTVTGNLDLHGVTKSITFPAVIKMEGDKLMAMSDFTINRFDFGIEYKGKADDLIKKEVLLKLRLEAPGA